MIPLNINQIDKALSRNIDHLDKENFNKLITLFQTQTQELQDAILTLADQKNIQTAEGIWLDWIGKIVGESRLSRTDEDYRKALLVKVSVNAADGTPDNISSIIKQAYEVDTLTLVEYPVAAFFLILTDTDQPTSYLWRLLDSVKPAGVNATAVYNQNGDRFVPAPLDSGNNFIGNTENALLNWFELTGFEIVTGGNTVPLQLHNGENLEIISGHLPTNDGHGYLSQIITENNL